jgi:NAD(P)H-nitrite reductase large subunit
MENRDENVIICRCQELTRLDIIQAVREGARTVNGVKNARRPVWGFARERLVSG